MDTRDYFPGRCVLFNPAPPPPSPSPFYYTKVDYKLSLVGNNTIKVKLCRFTWNAGIMNDENAEIMDVMMMRNIDIPSVQEV